MTLMTSSGIVVEVQRITKSNFICSAGCETLSRPGGPPCPAPGPAPHISKFSSLDRRRPRGPGPTLSAYQPGGGEGATPPRPRPSRPGKEPERRHSSYFPTSSLGTVYSLLCNCGVQY